uniref:ATP synthase subunit b', chloroplastic n=1 Tax=Antithamnion sp. TaxID=2767 RepID=ATPF2_ANTSP|nr:RecName: Full=ATP synthase subunit b', chloroplastic; AltName: Full=ATP synthase F(0) sector subunit b'; AltName: Full=ATPase subunit II [Antithamnion sp.]CAA44981.1 atpG [Antithamnion sp.]
MNNFLISLALQESSTEVQGGLFDFNATLPLMALQFLALTIILNLIYYKPLGKILDERDEYIANSLTAASAALSKANDLTKRYEQDLAESRKKAQDIIKNAQQDAQNIVSSKIKEAQKDADQLMSNTYDQLNIQKEQALQNLEKQVDILSNQIQIKLLGN